MQKKIGIFVVAALIIIIAVFAFKGESPNVYTSALGNEAALTLFGADEEISQSGFLEVDFVSSVAGEWYVNAFLQSPEVDSTEGMVEVTPPTLSIGGGDEFDIEVPEIEDNGGWIVKNMLTEIIPGTTNRFAFRLPGDFDPASDHVDVRIALTDTRVTVADDVLADAKAFTAPVQVVDIDPLLGLDVPGARPELKRGVGVPTAYAQLAGYDFFTSRDADVPDLSGGPLDCFAIATANNLLSLNDEHGANYDLPDPEAMIAELKRDMQWDDGILGPNFLTGKAAFVERYGLPITTREIKRPSMEDLEEALSNGDAVEVSMTHVRSASGRPSTGHVITGIGAWEDGGEAGITVHDPATPQGNDFLDITQSGNAQPYLIVNYPLWDGVSFIDAIYVQTWTEEEPKSNTNTSGVSLEEDEEESGVAIDEDEQALLDLESDLDSAQDQLGLFVETSFAHVAPGEYSEIYVRVPEVRDNQSVTVSLTGPTKEAVANPSKTQSGENGQAYFVFRIYSYGSYTVKIDRGGQAIERTVLVN